MCYFYDLFTVDLPVLYKECIRCKSTKTVNDFKSLKAVVCLRCKFERKKYNRKKWKKNNPEKVREDKKRYNSKPKQRARLSVSCLISQRLKTRNASKNKKRTFEILEYTVDDLYRNLESKFEEGMTWDNYGEWHIDHVIPDSWFNYDSFDHPDFKKSWSLKNLQPMWAKENISKGDRYKGKYKKEK